MMTKSTLSNSRKTVWSIWIRLIHLSFIILIPFLYWSAEQGWLNTHQYAGITLGVLVIIRIAIGFFANDYSSFKHFIVPPKQVFRYSLSFFKRSSPQYLSHNPMGGYMVIFLCIVLLTQFILGLFSMDDIFFSGPLAFLISSDLSEDLTRWHRRLFNLILWAIALHLLAVAWYQFYKKQAIIQSMVHGGKPELAENRENNE